MSPAPADLRVNARRALYLGVPLLCSLLSVASCDDKAGPNDAGRRQLTDPRSLLVVALSDVRNDPADVRIRYSEDPNDYFYDPNDVLTRRHFGEKRAQVNQTDSGDYYVVVPFGGMEQRAEVIEWFKAHADGFLGIVVGGELRAVFRMLYDIAPQNVTIWAQGKEDAEWIIDTIGSL